MIKAAFYRIIFSKFFFIALVILGGWATFGNKAVTSFNAITLSYPLLAFVIFAYFLSHLLRFARLALILMKNAESFKTLALTHFSSAWVSAVLPFKIGELFRACQLMRISRAPGVGAAAFIVEKAMDAVVLLLLISISSLSGLNPGADFRAFNIMLGILLVLAVFIWKGLPETIRYLRHIILTQSRSAKGIYYLQSIMRLERFQHFVDSTIQYRLSVIFMCSLLIWILDFLTIALLMTGDGYSLLFSLASFADSLNSVLGWDSGKINTSVQAAVSYRAIVILTLACCGIASSIFLLYRWHTPHYKNTAKRYMLKHRA